MNFFFGVKHDKITSSITIPKFQNSSKQDKKYDLYRATIGNEKWHIDKLNCHNDENFYFVEKELINNEDFFFLSKENDLDQKIKTNLLQMIKPNIFTKTHPAYRASLELTYEEGGFSSYQSEYPYGMIGKTSNILSPLGTLLNHGVEQNYLIFRNIHNEPVQKSFNLYIIDIDKLEILKTLEIFTNKSNIIPIDKTFINHSTYIYIDSFIGIPIFLSIDRGHLSFEHTHPPYHYILGEKNFKLANKLKNRIHEKIFQKNSSN